jgi:hypothetical protein
MGSRAEVKKKRKTKMKKLMIALAAVAMIGAAQAAATNWKFNLGTSGTLKNGYVLDKTPEATPAAMGGQLFYVLATTTISQADLVSAFQNNSGSINLASYALTSGNVNSSGKLPNASSISTSTEALEPGTAYDFYMAVVVDTDTDGKYDYLYVSASKSANAQDSSKTTTVTFVPGTSTSFQGDGAYSAAGWYAVPEPTSGLLMLLGMAGLALRRKRA